MKLAANPFNSTELDDSIRLPAVVSVCTGCRLIVLIIGRPQLTCLPFCPNRGGLLANLMAEKWWTDCEGFRFLPFPFFAVRLIRGRTKGRSSFHWLHPLATHTTDSQSHLEALFVLPLARADVCVSLAFSLVKVVIVNR